MVTLWDGEIKAIAGALIAWDESGKVIVLTNYQAVIAAIKKGGKIVKARTTELRKVIRKIEEEKRALRHKAVSSG